MQTKASTVDAYLKSLPEDRRPAITAIRNVILKNLDKDYEEGILYGMIGYFVPHRIFPAGYHCDPTKPLLFIALASQKNHMALYLSGIYGSEDEAKWFKAAWAKTGKKLDVGKSRVRFKKLEDLALDVIGESVKRISAKTYMKRYQDIRAAHKPTPRAEIAKRIKARAAAKGK
ncbi:MAG: hypothetical protein JWO13_3687 [Acidobacteriales bacterium]|nr:hypothetical protein [Terriglobales bacterium]